MVFQEPSANGSGLIDSASTEVTITGLSNPTSTQNISVSVFFEAIVTGPITPGYGVFFITAPGGLFDVAALISLGVALPSPKPRSIRGQTARGSITIAQEVNRPEPSETCNAGPTQLR